MKRWPMRSLRSSICLELAIECQFYWYPAILAALTVNVDDITLIAWPDVADFGTHQFVRTKAGEYGRQEDTPVALGPVRTAL